MAELTRTPSLAAEDLPYLVPEGESCELVVGELVREPPPSEGHGWLAGKVLVHVGHFVLERRLGRIYAAETGFVLARNPDTVRCPDVAFVSGGRLATTVSRGPYFEGAPDLAVEVVSPGDTERAVAGKAREYLEAGGSVVWVIDPARETVTVHTRRAAPRTLSRDQTLDGAPVLPGFQLSLAEIFRR